MKKAYLGIDPGIEGAVAVLGNGPLGPMIFDTPTVEIKDKKKSRRMYLIREMWNILEPFADPQTHAVLEQAIAMPGQNVVSTLKQGYGIGLWEALLVARGIPYTMVQPSTWKREMLEGMPKDSKEASIVRASQLFPSFVATRKKDHNRAEAVLLAEFCRKRHAA